MKTRTIILGCVVISITLIITILDSCKKEEQKIIKEKITGQVQKGPFINGTAVTMTELNSSLAQTGINFTTQITNNTGSFEINNISLSSSYVEYSASGFYFDEVKGELSMAPLNLLALSDLKDISTVNINVLTHLEKQRVNYLINKNKNFSEAKKTAQGEILSIFGFSPGNIEDSEMLDISVNDESNAILLAISTILQGNRRVADLTELLANISNDIKEDGNLNDTTIMASLRNSAKELDLASIRSNLEKRYQNLGVSATIPDFEKYVKEYLSFTGKKPTITFDRITDITTTTATFIGIVNPDYINTAVTFEWGKTTDYGNSVPAIQSTVNGGSSVNVSAIIKDLFPGTTYHLRVKAENKAGLAYSSDATFTTLGKVPEPVTMIATDIFLNSATLNGSVNPNYLTTNADFEFGTTTAYGNIIPTVQSPVNGSAAVSVSAALSGLTEETTYHYRIKAGNSLGTTYGADKTFTTAGKSPIPITKGAYDIQMNAVVIKGSVNANGFSTTVTFEWGTTSAYGNSVTAQQSPISAQTYTNVSSKLTGLVTGTTYHFRIKAENEYGSRTSEDMTFTTLSPVTDFEGNIYNIGTFGTQIWMIENLKSTKYSDGTPIGYGLYYPENNISHVVKYGILYDWTAAIKQPPKYDTIMIDLKGKRVQGVCPVNWHLPDEAEWLQLIDLFGGKEAAGLKLKIANPGYWLEPLNIQEPLSGFNAIPAGNRYKDGTYVSVGGEAWYWTTNQWYMGGAIMGRHVELLFFSPNVTLNYTNANGEPGSFGLSVRCIKD